MKRKIIVMTLILCPVIAVSLLASACGKKQDSSSANVSGESVAAAESTASLSANSVADSSDADSVSDSQDVSSLSAAAASSASSESENSSETESGTDSAKQEQDSSQYTGQQMEGETEATSQEIAENAPVTSGGNEIVFPDSSSEYISDEDISRLSDSQKQSAINEIYARHGYDFPDSSTKEFYEDFDWYTPTETDKSEVESSFNEYEKANVEALQK